MDFSKKYENPSPETKANPFSKLMFCWILPFFKFGYENDLQTKDLYNAVELDLSESLADALENNWNLEVEKAALSNRKPKLSKAIKETFIKPYIIHGVALFIQCIVLRMIHPLILAELINYFDKSYGYKTTMGWTFGLLVVVVAFLNMLIMHHVTFGTQRLGMRCRIACSSLLYRKLLKLSRTSLGRTAAGQLVNLMSNDVQRFDITPIFLHYLWIMPIQAMVAAFIMYKSVGYAAITGLVAITMQAVPLQGYLSRWQGKLRFKIAQRTDYRVKLMSEITSGIRVIKMYAWEKPFEKIVRLARKSEIDIITRTSYIRGFTVALMVFTERATLYLTVITYVLDGNRLTGDKVFSMAQFFNTIQLYMAIFYPLALAMLAEAKVSVKRLEEFLMLEENFVPKNNNSLTEKIGTVKLTKVQASWLPNPIVNTLNNISLEIKPGSLCAVVGNVGSGKSSLLQLLLKEMPLKSGRVEAVGTISYAAQEPWLFLSSVRNNILFGNEYNKSRYKNVVEVCALQTDFDSLPHSDKTLVGERGVSLSGGQRARINLARAVYRQADVYLFDDPLSAVDARVSKHLFEKCIRGYLNGKTRILATHQLHFLKDCDLILILNNGSIEKIGTFNELSDKELAHLKEEEIVRDDEETDKDGEEGGRQRKRLLSLTSHASTNADEDETEEPEETQELVEKGAISSSLYKQYFKAGASVTTLIFLVLVVLLAQAVSNCCDLWLKYWTNEEEFYYKNQLDQIINGSLITNGDSLNETDFNLNINQTLEGKYFKDDRQISKSTYIWIYTVFILGSIILTTFRSLLFFKICMNASKNLHNTMFGNVLQATMRFFDTNPSGRILNRFSKDMGTVDELLPRAMMDAIQIFMVMSGILIMVFIVTPWMILPTIFLAALFYYIRRVYLAGAQDIKRLEGVTKAPVFSHITATFSGLTTIRVCKAQAMVTKEFDVLQDQHTGTWILFLATSEAFGFYLDLLSVIFLAIVTFQFLIFDDGNTPSGDVGLVISQSLILTGMLQYGMRQTAEVANQMMSVERVLQYTKLDKEGPFESEPTKKPHRDWPREGSVSFENVNLRYVPNEEPVLKELQFEIKAGEKVGIVGRTGAGKSSLIAALFRLAPFDGSVIVDKINVKYIGLWDLRRNISIIPQDPVLFSSTVRNNLDPFNKNEDAALWKALEDVELKDSVKDLDGEVNEGGVNFSAGQRQLICLARAILRNNKILVMDEATANVDPQTDALIQATIRKNFKDCTVVTIAHRLNTVMDSDKILVMNAGRMVEFGPPHELLQDENGYLSVMVRQTGKEMEQKLKRIAREVYDKVPRKEELDQKVPRNLELKRNSIKNSSNSIKEEGADEDLSRGNI